MMATVTFNELILEALFGGDLDFDDDFVVVIFHLSYN